MTLIEEAAGVSLITPQRLVNLCASVNATMHLKEDMAELGVYRGGSALVISGLAPERTLHLFDTFTGLPHTERAEHNPTNHDLNEGRFACALSQVAPLFVDRAVIFHEGVFPESAKGMEDVRFSFVHIDCDLYQSARDGIGWFWPRMVPGGIMYFDDYGCDFTGVTDAVHEVFKESQIIKQRDDSNGFQIGAFVKK
jgi:hypothetical protein